MTDMKVVITSSGNSIESTLDLSFGRCEFFVVYDSESKSIEFVPNPNRLVEESAGTGSVQLMQSLNVKKVISGEFGMRVKPLFDSMRIQMIIFRKPGVKILQIIELLNH